MKHDASAATNGCLAQVVSLETTPRSTASRPLTPIHTVDYVPGVEHFLNPSVHVDGIIILHTPHAMRFLPNENGRRRGRKYQSSARAAICFGGEVEGGCMHWRPVCGESSGGKRSCSGREFKEFRKWMVSVCFPEVSVSLDPALHLCCLPHAANSGCTHTFCL